MTLPINDDKHPLFKLSRLDPNGDLPPIDLAFFLVSKQKEADRYYRAKEFALSEAAGDWLKRQIVKETGQLQIREEDGSVRFEVGPYNLEAEKPYRLAQLTLSEKIGLPYVRKQAILGALANPDEGLKQSETEFQVVQLNSDGRNLYFFYYRKPKRSTSKKRILIGRSGELDFADDGLIELGGKIEFVLLDNELYIANLRHFEYVFDYRDHIVQARDRNLNTITGMSFFDIGQEDKERFKRDCAAFFHTRTVAQMGPRQLEALERNFKARCDDLRRIRKGMPRNAERAKEYRNKYAPLWELYEFLDLEQQKVIYPENSRPTTLLHFFADKIIQSFLTGDFGVADSMQPAEESSAAAED
ncbi:DUF4868 domain-containing protein [Saccharibacillus sp. CPCC 101409]|uniref:Kiwa anti-phage protein KwaB-like domain-containing protein n=1 Tax=Saccharibacillus sp. CPCC 101409 TaxID=3058041 RepID=UPI002672F3BD|nr:Kiwa anti-phage protein KwaB-like domain-containing protein [Saccharibacillus sp. CPCC 101409]MDO3409464.1 DUF4868 domain-containing protein [Saccharibacillus sp. CPCC 101409]